MINSKYVNKKILIPVAIIAVAVGLAIWGLPAIAVVNQTINSGAPGYTQLAYNNWFSERWTDCYELSER